MKLAHTFTATVLIVSCLSTPSGVASAKSPTRKEIKLAYGFTEVKLGALSVRIVKGMVGNGTASSFDTYTVYLMPENAGEPWMQIIAPSDKGITYSFRNVESGDATAQAILFYTQDNRLYVMQANKIGAAADAHGSRRTPFDFEAFKYNNSEDVPMFNSEGKSRSKGTYVNGTEAIEHEFIGK